MPSLRTRYARFVRTTLCLVAGALVAAPTYATAFSTLYAFGDSLSDGGDNPGAVISIYKLFPSECPPSPPYLGCRFSNGPVAVEDLARSRGLNNPTTFQDWAVGGFTTARIKDTIQVYLGLSGGRADRQGLYVIWGGPNDFFQGSTDVTAAAKNIFDSAQLLLNAGATKLLIPNMPDLSRTPSAAAQAEALGPVQGPSFLAALQALSLGFDNALAGEIATLDSIYPLADIVPFNTLELFTWVLDNPRAFGLDN